MAYTLTITDNGNSTGTLVIAGSDPTSTNRVSLYSFTGEAKQLGVVTVLTSSVEGDRTQTFSATAGHYIFVAETTIAGVLSIAAVAYASITDGTKSVYQKILEATQTKIRSIGLAGVSSANVLVREVPISRDMTAPGVVIAPQRSIMSPTAGTNQQDDVVYGVIVGVFDNDNQSQSNTAKYTLWLEQIAKAFRGYRLEGASEVYNCVAVPSDAISLRDWYANKFIGAILLQFTARELRA